MCSRYIRVFSNAAFKYYNYSSIQQTQMRVTPLKLFSTSSNLFITDQSKVNEKHDSPSSEESISEEKIETQMSEKEKEILEENQKLLERLKEIDDKYKRSLAENENIRMRMRREITDAKQYGIQNFVKDLLDVSDVLKAATESVPKEALSNNPDLKNLFEGLKMTETQLQSVFRRYGVTLVNPIGEKFDPNLHEALFEHEDPAKEPGTVGLVTKVGYKLHERIIRPALVAVIKASR